MESWADAEGSATEYWTAPGLVLEARDGWVDVRQPPADLRAFKVFTVALAAVGALLAVAAAEYGELACEADTCTVRASAFEGATTMRRDEVLGARIVERWDQYYGKNAPLSHWETALILLTTRGTYRLVQGEPRADLNADADRINTALADPTVRIAVRYDLRWQALLPLSVCLGGPALFLVAAAALGAFSAIRLDPIGRVAHVRTWRWRRVACAAPFSVELAGEGRSSRQLRIASGDTVLFTATPGDEDDAREAHRRIDALLRDPWRAAPDRAPRTRRASR